MVRSNARHGGGSVYRVNGRPELASHKFDVAHSGIVRSVDGPQGPMVESEYGANSGTLVLPGTPGPGGASGRIPGTQCVTRDIGHDQAGKAGHGRENNRLSRRKQLGIVSKRRRRNRYSVPGIYVSPEFTQEEAGDHRLNR